MKNSLFIGVIFSLFFSVVGCSETLSTDSTEATSQITDEVRTDTVDYLALGKEIAQMTFGTLSEQLKEQITTNGVESAIGFCSVEAMPLTDSLSQLKDVEIQRLAVRYRNPKNEATGHDLEVFNGFASLKENGLQLTALMDKNEADQNVFYAPIILKAQCVVCHGEPETQIAPSTLAVLNNLYPTDQAIGFKEGDLRGMWKITFKN